MEDVEYPKVIEHFVCRNFEVGDRVQAYFKGEWVHGTVVEKYKKREEDTPYILIRTDKMVDDEPDALLGGFGLESIAWSPRTIFEHEQPFRGDEIYSRTFEREMTDEEKKDEDNLPF